MRAEVGGEGKSESISPLFKRPVSGWPRADIPNGSMEGGKPEPRNDPHAAPTLEG